MNRLKLSITNMHEELKRRSLDTLYEAAKTVILKREPTLKVKCLAAQSLALRGLAHENTSN